MTASSKPTAVERTFEDVPEAGWEDGEGPSFLSDIGLSRGVGWADLLKSRRILIISEAGVGKTFECQARHRILWDAGEPAFFIELAQLAREPFDDLLGPEESARFAAWRTAQSDVATFFLDSFDELKLTQGSFRTALLKLSKVLAGRLGRARIVLTTRPVPIDRQLVEAILPVPSSELEVPDEARFADVAMRRPRREGEGEPDRALRVVAMAPLSDGQILEMAVIEGVGDPKEMLAEIRRRDMIEYARRPQDLIGLCAAWRDRGLIGSHREQVAADVARKLRPADRGERAQLSHDRALEGAARLALAVSLSRRLTIRHSSEGDSDAGTGSVLDPAEILFDWTAEEVATLLERPLFGFSSYGRVRFRNISVVEFLAARQLAVHLDRGHPLASVKRLIFAETAQGECVVRPALRPVAAWLSLDSDAVFSEVLQREPEVLLGYGDPGSLADGQRARALRAYANRHGAGGWRGLRVPTIQAHRFASQTLAPLIIELWPELENEEVRELFVDLVAEGRMAECANIAHEAATNSEHAHGVRLGGLRALSRIADVRLPEVLTSIATDDVAWPDRLARAALATLLSEGIDAVDVVRIVSRVRESRRSVGYLTYHLPRHIAEADLPRGELKILREGLSEIATDGLTWTSVWPHYQSPRPEVLPALAAAAAAELAAGESGPGLLRAIVVAIRTSGRDHDFDDHTKRLRLAVAEAGPSIREGVFWAENEFLDGLKPQPDRLRRLFDVAEHGVVRLDPRLDSGWAKAVLEDRNRTEADRALMLEAMIRRLWDGDGAWPDHVRGLRTAVADAPALSEALDAHLAPRIESPEYEELEAECRRRREQEEDRERSDHESWIAFWREVSASPETAFEPGKSERTSWNLWRAMEATGDDGRASGWNRRFIEEHFGREVADRMRLALRAVWRSMKPTMPREREESERNTFLTKWQLGLAAVAAEAEDPNWAQALDHSEALHACRYVSLDFGGFPSWLDSLARAHPDAVREMVGPELAAELDRSASEGGGWLLQCVENASPDLAEVFLPAIRTWLTEHGDRVGHNQDAERLAARLRRVTDILLKFGADDVRRQLRDLALSRLSDGLATPFAAVWMPILMKLDAEAATDALDRGLESIPPARDSAAVHWFADLFGHSMGSAAVGLASKGFTPGLLLRLARLARKHVRECDELHREGSYTPTPRDDAQHARDGLVGAVMGSTGPDGWRTKLEMAADPDFSEIRDRILAVARERSAEEAAAAVLTPQEIVALHRRGEAPPATRDDMFRVLMDRLDDIDDLLLQDVSPREQLAGITGERVMRRAVALLLKHAARDAYKIDQEAVTADEKETDIRLLSVVTDEVATIELKLGEKGRSARDLRDALRDQLVGKYMAADHCRAGCLLVTVASTRTWEDPDTGERLDLDGLIAMLNAAAREIMDEMGGALRLAARGLDLRPRLLSEREASIAKKEPNVGG